MRTELRAQIFSRDRSATRSTFGVAAVLRDLAMTRAQAAGASWLSESSLDAFAKEFGDDVLCIALLRALLVDWELEHTSSLIDGADPAEGLRAAKRLLATVPRTSLATVDALRAFLDRLALRLTQSDEEPSAFEESFEDYDANRARTVAALDALAACALDACGGATESLADPTVTSDSTLDDLFRVTAVRVEAEVGGPLRALGRAFDLWSRARQIRPNERALALFAEAHGADAALFAALDAFVPDVGLHRHERYFDDVFEYGPDELEQLRTLARASTVGTLPPVAALAAHLDEMVALAKEPEAKSTPDLAARFEALDVRFAVIEAALLPVLDEWGARHFALPPRAVTASTEIFTRTAELAHRRIAEAPTIRVPIHRLGKLE